MGAPLHGSTLKGLVDIVFNLGGHGTAGYVRYVIDLWEEIMNVCCTSLPVQIEDCTEIVQIRECTENLQIRCCTDRRLYK